VKLATKIQLKETEQKNIHSLDKNTEVKSEKNELENNDSNSKE